MSTPPRHGRPYYAVRAIARATTKIVITLVVLAALASPSLITGPF